MSKFSQAVKSTIDKLLATKAQELSVGYIDIDDLSAIRKITDTSDTAVVCHFEALAGRSNNFHDGKVNVGCRLASDPGNYSLIGMLDDVSSLFRTGMQIPVKNYASTGVGATLGTIIIQKNELQATETLGAGNIRFREVGFIAYEFV